AFPIIDHHDLSQEMPEWAMRDLLIRFAGEEGVVWLDDVAPTVLISILCFIALRFPMTNSYQQRQQGDSCQE
ncbi:hypothetical protein OAI33_14880, partial [Pirellulaceae bacterium]|nr:hypothetical protein [Pirellulaceae bacterium]